MKKFAFILFAVILIAKPVSSFSQAKKGWSIGPLPAIGYNSDLGFQYGALEVHFLTIYINSMLKSLNTQKGQVFITYFMIQNICLKV
jgi:hypothetical protein